MNGYLRKDTDHNMYAAKIEAIGLAGNIIKRNIEEHTRYIIYTDNQAIEAIGKSKQPSDQAIINKKRTLHIIEEMK